MAERSLFFNAVETSPGVYDREYQESDFADYFGSVLSTGLLHTGNIPGMAVSVEAGTLNTIVSAGKAIMKGHLYENTTNITLTHNIPEATMDRIDRIVLRLDLRNQSRFIKLFIKEGAPATTPVPADLQRDNFIYEISLAQIRVRQNTVRLQESDLVDERLNQTLCGLASSLITVPVEQFQAQWDKFMSGIINEGFAHAVDFNAHKADDIAHNIPVKVIKLNKDDNGIFTTVEYRRKTDDSLAKKSVLSGGMPPLYTTRTITYYDKDGMTELKSDVFTLSYDADSDLVSEV